MKKYWSVLKTSQNKKYRTFAVMLLFLQRAAETRKTTFWQHHNKCLTLLILSGLYMIWSQAFYSSSGTRLKENPVFLLAIGKRNGASCLSFGWKCRITSTSKTTNHEISVAIFFVIIIGYHSRATTAWAENRNGVILTFFNLTIFLNYHLVWRPFSFTLIQEKIFGTFFWQIS